MQWVIYLAKEKTESIKMTQNINQELLTKIKYLFTTMVGKALLKIGIGLAAVAAAVQLIPDQAVMDKKEIEEGMELDLKEQMIRKGAVIAIIAAGLTIPSFLTSIFQLSRAQGITPKLLALARVLTMTPTFMTAYALIKRKIEQQDPTLNIRTLAKDMPIEPSTQAKMIAGGIAAQGAIMGAHIGHALANAPTA